MGASHRSAVVGAAIVRDGRVLAARRTSPPESAGRWEFPGGKVEPGETPEAALVREIGEELGCTIVVDAWLPGEVAIGERYSLTVAVVRIVSGEPVADASTTPCAGSGRTSSTTSTGSTPTGRSSSTWSSDDGPGMMATVRGIFFDEDDARAVVARLIARRLRRRTSRERLAGEDDDEDHPWAVLSDAPALVLELLVEEYDGWLDAEDLDPSTRRPPLELPTEPRKIKRL